MLKQKESPPRSRKRWCKRTSCHIEGGYTIGLCISRFFSEKGSSMWTWKIQIKTRRQILQRHLAPNENSGKKGSRGETLHQERCARRAAWDLAKNLYKLKNADKATFYTTMEVRVMLAPTLKRPEEREFVVDSGASVYMMGKKDESSEELDTLRRSRNTMWLSICSFFADRTWRSTADTGQEPTKL